MRLALLSSALILLACEGEELLLVPGDGPEPAAGELGRIESIYPHLLPTEEWILEYAFPRDTAYVDYKAAKEIVKDSLWKRALTTKDFVFKVDSVDAGKCLVPIAQGVQGCLPFKTFSEVYGDWGMFTL